MIFQSTYCTQKIVRKERGSRNLFENYDHACILNPPTPPPRRSIRIAFSPVTPHCTPSVSAPFHKSTLSVRDDTLVVIVAAVATLVVLLAAVAGGVAFALRRKSGAQNEGSGSQYDWGHYGFSNPAYDVPDQQHQWVPNDGGYMDVPGTAQ